MFHQNKRVNQRKGRLELYHQKGQKGTPRLTVTHRLKKQPVHLGAGILWPLERMSLEKGQGMGRGAVKGAEEKPRVPGMVDLIENSVQRDFPILAMSLGGIMNRKKQS